MNIKAVVSLSVLLLMTAGCRTRGGGGGFATEHHLLHPEQIAMAMKSDLEKDGFTVSVVTNGAHHLAFCGNTVTGSVTAATSGVDWRIRQYRWRPWGGAEYERAVQIINQNMKE